jgi:polysaccharide pyruvyl transferase WcaK-like protein
MATPAAITFGTTALAITAQAKPKRLLLRSSWQTVNIGDIAHTPGMLRLLEQHLPEVTVTLWPSSVADGVQELLRSRFPKLQIATTKAAKEAALAECDFCLHGSGPGLVGWRELETWKATGKPYGFGGVTLSDAELKDRRELLAGAKFVFCRDTDSLAALKASGITGPRMEFGPDATFALDLADDTRAEAVLREHKLEVGKFLCAVPRLRYTPYWKIHPERKFPPGQIEERTAINGKFREMDHAKLREAIVAWVRQTGQRVLLCPEMTYAVEELKPLLFDPLPDDVKPHVTSLNRYWLTAEAASVYARAFAVVSFEMHSPIIAIANGTPAIHLRQPTDTRKGQMWRDVRLADWLFEIDSSEGQKIAERLLAMHADTEKTKTLVQKARQTVDERFRAMMDGVREGLA